MKPARRIASPCLFAAALASALANAACITTTTIRSDPPGAHIWVREQYVGRAPVSLPLSDGPLAANRVFVRAELEGHQGVVMPLEQDAAAGWIVLDTFLVLMTAGLAAPLYMLNSTVHRSEYLITLPPASTAMPAASITVDLASPWSSSQSLDRQQVFPPPPVPPSPPVPPAPP